MNALWKATNAKNQSTRRRQSSWRKTTRLLSQLALLTIMSGNSVWPTAVSAQVTPPFVKEETIAESIQPDSDDPVAQTSSVVQLTGHFGGFIPGTNRFLTYHYETDSSTLHDEQGREIAVVEGILQLFSPDGERFITYADGTTTDEAPLAYLYDSQGNEITALEGIGQAFSPDGQYLVTANAAGATTNLYDVTGQKLTVLSGYFGNFSPNSQQVATFEVPSSQTSIPTEDITEQAQTHLYTLADGNITTVTGAFSGFNAAGGSPEETLRQRIVTYGLNTPITYLYDHTGRELASFPGESPQGFYSEESILATIGDAADPNIPITRLYDHNGEELASLKGVLTNVDDSAMYFITDDYQGTPLDLEDDIDYLYDRSGRQISAFPGQSYWVFTEGSDRLLGNSFNNTTTAVYDVATGDELATLDGMIGGIGPAENQWVVYTEIEEESSHFYDSSANKIRSLPGTFQQFSPSGELTAVVEYWAESDDGIAESRDVTSDERLNIDSVLDPVTYLYDQAGHLVTSVEGISDSFSEDGSRVVTYDLTDNVYRLLIIGSSD